MEASEYLGEWWLPERRERKVPGTLRVAESGRTELALIGTLRPHLEAGEARTENGVTTVSFTEESLENSGSYSRIHGLVGSTAITLDDCFRTQWSGGMMGSRATERIHVAQMFHGVWLDVDEPQEFSAVYAHMDWLAYWVMQSGIREEVTYRAPDGIVERHEKSLIWIEPVDAIELVGPDGARVAVGQSYQITGDSIANRTISQDFYFGVEYGEPRSLATLMAQVSDLQDLVTMGTGRVAGFRKLSLRHVDITRTVGDKTYRLPIEYVAQWHAIGQGPTPTLHRHEMLFSLDELGGAPGLQAWLSVAEMHRSALSRVMGTRYAKSMYVSDRVLNLAAALEAYDRTKHADDIFYVDRIKRCIHVAGPPFTDLVDDPELWAVTLKDVRNAVAHHGTRIDDGSTLHLFLAESAYWLFTLLLLRDSAAPGVVFDRMHEHAQFRWLRRGLRDSLH